MEINFIQVPPFPTLASAVQQSFRWTEQKIGEKINWRSELREKRISTIYQVMNSNPKLNSISILKKYNDICVFFLDNISS